MLKSIYSPEYRTMVRLLRKTREQRGLTQEQVARSLSITASMLSKWELGERRIDLRELDLYLRACEADLVDFVASWQQAIRENNVVVGIEVKLRKGRPVPKSAR
ncbi:MAG: helix-turn-helix transcriptional regulator [Armatimonadetes bacterium]|nr:helix-turn-helix transcriptional regulator [Armatimonadota bacterium]